MGAHREPLSRGALARVLQSLLTAELAFVRRRAGVDPSLGVAAGAWPESLQIFGDRLDGLGCDSLETVWLAGATNEMFHLHEMGHETGLLSAPSFGEWIDHILGAWRAGVSRITFTTSGSTGAPKRCAHDISHLQTEIAYLAEVFATRRRVVAMTPPHHIYGFLFAALLPERLGIPVLGPTEATVQALQSGDLIVSFPDHWAYLNRFVPTWPANIAGVVSTAPCSMDLIADLRARGLASMTEIYGSSETAGVALRVWPDATYHLMPFWRFDEPLAAGAPVVVHASGLRRPLMDQISLGPDNGFTLVGRHDGAVQVGGTNVFPDRIAALLRARPGVEEACVRLMRPDEGDRLKAFVVPAAGVCESELRDALEAWCRATLPPCERPKAITFGMSLPAGIMGKRADW